MAKLEDGEDGGISAQGELYRISESLGPALEVFSEPPNLYRGKVFLEDGSEAWAIL